MLGVTVVLAKKVFVRSLSVRIKSVQGFALKLSQPACLFLYDPKSLERVVMLLGLISITEKEMLTGEEKDLTAFLEIDK